uniref:Uncharacterized protein n=1 Tax=Nelumbo nucifera TaxID=4432 RepID=A0A822XMU4_NELNU|nr:TPA_asm: hypothetical protein HUJ06_022835 [Nelumbo nucifera]
MSRSEEQTVRKTESAEEEKDKSPGGEELPVESSPYVNYSDLEDYKRRGYGTEGHQEPKPGRGAGATDAPTLSGSGLSERKVAAIHDVNIINGNQGVP